MAAATVESTIFSDPGVYRASFPGNVIRSWEHASSTDVGEDGDKVKFFKVPKFAKIEWGRLFGPDADSGTALVVQTQITNGTTTKVLHYQSDVGQAGGIQEPVEANIVAGDEDAIGWVVDDDDYWIEVEVITSATGETAGAWRLQLECTFLLEQGESP